MLINQSKAFRECATARYLFASGQKYGRRALSPCQTAAPSSSSSLPKCGLRRPSAPPAIKSWTQFRTTFEINPYHQFNVKAKHLTSPASLMSPTLMGVSFRWKLPTASALLASSVYRPPWINDEMIIHTAAEPLFFSRSQRRLSRRPETRLY